MSESRKTSEKPLVGFFPLSYNLAETGRAILVAKQYEELGGKAVFFSHGGKYEYLAEDFGYKIVRVKPIYTEKLVKEIVSISRGEKKGVPYKVSFLREAVREEIAAYKKTGVKMIVSFVNSPCSISARAAKIPLVCVSPGGSRFFLAIPDNYENCFTRLLPQWFKIQFFNWFFNHSKKFLKPFNTVAREYGLKSSKSAVETISGDIVLATNFLEFIDVFPNQQQLPAEEYIGIILLEELFANIFSIKNKRDINNELLNHLETMDRSILFTMGSSGDKTLFLKILHALNKTRYRVIAVYANILDENELPELNDNILLKKFVPSVAELHKMVDLAIIHGGQGTVYTAAYAGKPIIGFPMQAEQHLHLEKMVGHGSGLMLSKKYYKEKDLLRAIKDIFDNYDTYLNNAQVLAEKLPKPEGDKNAARRIVEILRDEY